MSYRDPYSGHYAAGAGSSNYHPDESQYNGAAQNYNPYPANRGYDNAGADSYYQYPSNTQPYQDEYRQGPYQDDYGYSDNQAAYNYPPVQRKTTQKSVGAASKKSKPSVSVVPAEGKNSSGFERGEFTPAVPRAPKDRTARALREYRYDHQGNLWSKGGRTRMIGRLCFCTLMTVIFLIVTIILSLALWIRPPSVSVGKVETETLNGSPVQQLSDGIQVDMSVNISVNNPSYLSVDFTKIQAEIFYPPNETPIGGGYAANIKFNSDTQTNFTFPFSLRYKTSDDPKSAVILDLASKCGVGGNARSDITVDYKITLGIRIALITISPVIRNQFTFPCPLQASDISKFIGGG